MKRSHSGMKTSGAGGAVGLPWRRWLVALLVGAAVVLPACDDNDTAQDVREQTEEVAEDAAAAAQDAWASLRTDAERLVDEIQTRNDPMAKERLLERCRDALEELRKAESDQADRAEQVCDRIRDTDVNDRDAWSDVKDRIEDINPGS